VPPTEIRPGRWRWSAPHPEWKPSSDWPLQVGCVLYETPGHAVLIDPLVPADDGALSSWLERRCGSREVTVLETIRFHSRSGERLRERYGASAAAPGVESFSFPAAGETVYWIPEHRALVPGDLLVVDGGTLALCPQGWLDDMGHAPRREELAVQMRVLLALEPELVVVSHGEPVLGGGTAALAGALEAA